MSYEILTDSCCDLSPALCRELGIFPVSLTVEFHGRVFDDVNDDSLQAFYAGLRSGDTAKTSAVNPSRWRDAMEGALLRRKDVLVLAFSSGLSATCQSAVIAARELEECWPERKIIVIDTLCASLGQGLLVYLACQKRTQGMALEDLAAWVEETKRHICHWFTVDDLMCLKRGGRVSSATAVMGTMLQIKPVLHMDDAGHLVNMAKARGRKAALDALAMKFGQLGKGWENNTVFLSHGNCLEDARYLEGLLKTQYGVKKVVIHYVGAVIGSHSGPGTVALFFLGNRR